MTKRLWVFILLLPFLISAQEFMQHRRKAFQPVSGGAVSYPTANLQLWCEATSLSLNDGDNVTSWSDSSPNGWNLGSPSASAPTYETNIINGLPVVQFTQTNVDWMTNHGVASFVAGTDKPFTAVLLCNVTLNDNTGYVFYFGKESGVSPRIFLQNNANSTRIVVRKFDDASANTDVTLFSSKVNNFRWYTLACNGTTFSWYTNGILHSSGNNIDVGAATLDRFAVGADSRNLGTGPIDMQLAIIGFYSVEITASDLVQIGTYITNKYTGGVLK